MRNQEIVEEFISEMIIKIPTENGLECSKVFELYLLYCRCNNFKQCTNKTFINLMKKEFELEKIDGSLRIKNILTLDSDELYKKIPIEPFILRKDYGEIVLTKIENGNQFISLMDSLVENEVKTLPSEKGFRHNRNKLVENFKRGELYGLSITETEGMRERNAMIPLNHIDF